MKRTGTVASSPTAVSQYWSRPPSDILAELSGAPDGLSTAEAQERLAARGTERAGTPSA